ncbi:MAG TPA: hypothetical protein IAA66_10130 [Candidatus Avichristensenella intestinipullorum]|uniref:Uncharacterized protein n=1 Tax=Candidatus Avichristensenella intestinipullorum TaxID=2840693 RepID=A0A9D0YYT5_9FIRM|nr:hypothetical protein [Candidatus Avichristensenella intestinipullorum]
MQGGFRRRLMILRDAQGKQAGFVRLQRRDGRSSAQAFAHGLEPRAQAVLLGPEVAPCYLGPFVRDEAARTPLPRDESCYTQVAVLCGDRVVLTGGQEAEPARILRALRPAGTPRRQTAEPAGTETKTAAAEACAPEDRAEAARVTEDGAEAVRAPEDGWQFLSLQTTGFPERIEGRRYVRGQPRVLAHGVAGSFAPQPPPGLPGARWLGGFWLLFTRADGADASRP